jgi:hypothetical protein
LLGIGTAGFRARRFGAVALGVSGSHNITAVTASPVRSPARPYSITEVTLRDAPGKSGFLAAWRFPLGGLGGDAVDQRGLHFEQPTAVPACPQYGLVDQFKDTLHGQAQAVGALLDKFKRGEKPKKSPKRHVYFAEADVCRLAEESGRHADLLLTLAFTGSVG